VITGITTKGERTRLTSPVFSGRYVYWLLEDLRRHTMTVGRSLGAANSTLEWITRRMPGRIDSMGFDGRRLMYANGRGVHEATDPVPKFSARD
jgi:hypothetical protein